MCFFRMPLPVAVTVADGNIDLVGEWEAMEPSESSSQRDWMTLMTLVTVQ
jgi:hypothetical protein